jgi:hypothetical protein
MKKKITVHNIGLLVLLVLQHIIIYINKLQACLDSVTFLQKCFEIGESSVVTTEDSPG